MIDLTPLDVRKKRGDFLRGFRGYDTQQVDAFLELAAERLEELVKENLTLSERVERLGEQVAAYASREQAVNDALVTAQQLREDIANSANREAEIVRREALADADRMRSEAEAEAESARMTAETEAERIVSSAERRVEELQTILADLERRRARFLGSFRTLLERELDNVEVQEGRTVDEDVPVELDLGPRPLPSVVDIFAARTAAEDREIGAGGVGAEVSGDPGLDEDDLDREFAPSSSETVEAAEVLASAMERIEQTPLGVFDPAPPVPLPLKEGEEVEAEAPDTEAPETEAPDTEARDTEASATASPDDGVDAGGDDGGESEDPVEPSADVPQPETDPDVHRLATDTRLAADPPPSGTDWLRADDNDRR